MKVQIDVYSLVKVRAKACKSDVRQIAHGFKDVACGTGKLCRDTVGFATDAIKCRRDKRQYIKDCIEYAEATGFGEPSEE